MLIMPMPVLNLGRQVPESATDDHIKQSTLCSEEKSRSLILGAGKAQRG